MNSADAARNVRPLVVRCGAFGDMVLVTALIRDLSSRFGGPVDVLTSGPWSEPLLRGQPGVGDVVTVRSRKTPYWLSRDQQRAVRWLRKKHKRLRGRRKAQDAWNRAIRQRPRFFAHWAWVTWIPAVW